MDVSPGCLGRVGVLVLVVVFGDAKVGRVVVFDEVGGAALAVCVAVPKAVVGVLGEFISVRDNSLAFARSTFKAVAGEATGVFVAVAVIRNDVGTSGVTPSAERGFGGGHVMDGVSPPGASNEVVQLT